MLSVTVVCPNNHRIVVNCDGQKTFYNILDEACKRQGYDSRLFILCQNKKKLDLTIPFCMSGLPNNCTLFVEPIPEDEIVKVSQVQVCIQLTDGQRFTACFENDATLFDVLLEFHKKFSKQIKLEERNFMHPCLQYLNVQIVGNYALKNTTLRKLGILDKVLFRYSMRHLEQQQLDKINADVDAEKLKEEALNKEFKKKLEARKLEEDRANQVFEEQRIKDNNDLLLKNSVENNTKCDDNVGLNDLHSFIADKDSEDRSSTELDEGRLGHLEGLLSEVNRSIHDGIALPVGLVNSFVPDGTFKFPKETEGMDLTNEFDNMYDNENQDNNAEPCPRDTTIFKIDFSKSCVGNQSESEDFFKITIADAKLLQERLREERETIENRLLISDAQIKIINERRKCEAWPVTVLRFKIPGLDYVIQGVFYSLEKIGAVYDFVTELCALRQAKFVLAIPPAIYLHNRNATILEANLSPCSTILICKDKHNNISASLPTFNLKQEYLMKYSATIDIANAIAKKRLSANKPFQRIKHNGLGVTEMKSIVNSTIPTLTSGASKCKDSKTPKWMNIGSKK